MLSYFLFFSASYDVCPCETSTTSNQDCCCAGLLYRSQYPEDCYPLTKKSIIPKCPESHFQEKLPLSRWLVEELFCLVVDNRKSNKQSSAKQFSSTNTTSYVPTYEIESYYDSTATGYSPNDMILDASKEIIYLPTSSSSIKCSEKLPLNFLYGEDRQKCRTSGISISNYKDISIPKTPSSTENATIYFVDISTGDVYNSTNLTETGNIDELALYIYYTTSGSIEEVVFNYNTTTSTDYLMTVSVDYIESGLELSNSFQSGDVGYQLGGNIIAAKTSTVGENVTMYFDNESLQDNIFPIPFGDCSLTNFQYVPLKFGADTYTGCTSADKPDVSYEDLYIARHANPDPSLKGDWVQITKTSNTACSSSDQYSFTFYTSKTGTVKRPIYQINHVDLECSSKDSSHFSIVASFINIPQKTVRNIGNFPLKLLRIESDTFYPFSRPVH